MDVHVYKQMEKSGVGPQCASIITCNSKDKKKKQISKRPIAPVLHCTVKPLSQTWYIRIFED